MLYIIGAVITGVVLAGLLFYGYLSNFFLRVEKYKVRVPGNREERMDAVRIVMLADLHGGTFGRGNERLCRAVCSQKPDFICMAGDMTVKDGKGMDTCLSLCRELLKVCPVYYVPGNHEIRMPQWEQFAGQLKETGVYLLDNSRMHFFAGGRKFCVYGLEPGEFYYHKFWQKRQFGAREITERLGPADKESISILLAHTPEYFQAYHDWGADLVFSGHVHGGIARLPVLGGVIDPSLRLFPKYDAGMFREGDSVMILTRGLGTHHIRFRFFNVPEISVVELT